MKLLILLLLIPISLFSQLPGPGTTLTLEECINIALEKNYDLQIMEERIEVAEAGVRSAFGRYLPSITANAGYSRQLNNLTQSLVFGDRVFQSSQNPNRYNLGAYARLPLFDGFTREYNYSTANYNLESVKFDAEQVKRDIKIQIYRAYTEIVKNTQIVRIRQENIDLGKANLDKIKTQVKVGVSSMTEVYSQEAELGNLEYDLLGAQNTLYSSKADLLTIMGLEPDLDVNFDINSIPSDVTQKEVESFYENHNDKKELIREAMNNRYDIKSYNFSQNAAKSAKEAAKGSYYPDLTASTGWSWANTEFQDFSERGNFALGLNLNIPIFNNFQTDQQVQNAEMQFRQAEIEKLRLENKIRNDVKLALLNLETSQKQIIVTEKSLAASKRNYESVVAAHDVGAADLVELQKANTQYISSQLNRVNAVYGYFKARKELLYSIGVEQ